MTTSVIMSITNRPNHLRNTLCSWCNVDYVSEFIIIDNASNCPENEQVVEEFKERLNISFYKEPNWTNMNILWNIYGKMSHGDYIIFAMQDEIVVGRDLVLKMQDYVPFRSSIFTYFLDKIQTEALEGISWQDNPFIIPQPETTATSAGLVSHVTGAWRHYWDWFGWFRNEPKGHLWLDQDLHLRELALVNHCKTPVGVYCLHQHHKTSFLPPDFGQPGYHYANEMQARLIEPAERDLH